MEERNVQKKYCIVPRCPNTTRNAPNKLFITVPKDEKVNKAWQIAMRRKEFVKGTCFCCEDHFNPPEDIENFMYLKIMKEGVIRLKPGVVPHIFDCQKSRPDFQSVKPRPLIKKRQQEMKDSKNKMLNVFHNQRNEIGQIEKKAVVSQGVQVNIKPPRKNASCQWEDIFFTAESTKKRKPTLEDEVPRKTSHPSTSST
nr:uncharacterized protein LOC111517203 [Leptinotarsa decemlineata]